MQQIKHHIKKGLIKRPFLWATLTATIDHKYRQAFLGMKLLIIRRKTIISANTLGFSNRLKCLLSCMHAMEKGDGSVVLYWPKNWACRCNFSDLFETEFLEIDSEAYEILKPSGNFSSLIYDTWRLRPLTNEIPTDYRPTITDNDVSNIDLEYENTPHILRQKFGKQIIKLKPIKHIRDQAKSFSVLFSAHTISVSIRSWPDCKERADAFFDIDNIFNKLDPLINNNFFVSCDSGDILDSLIERYGDRIIYYPKRTLTNDRTSSKGMQDILIDLLLLGENNKFLVSYMSTYPELAWWFGDCKAEVQYFESRQQIDKWHSMRGENTVSV